MLPSSGNSIGLSQVNTELRLTPEALITLNDTRVRGLAVKPSGIIAMSDLHGKEDRVIVDITLSASTNNYVLDPSKVSGYIAGVTNVTLTINSGVVVGSGSTSGTGLTVQGFTTGDRISIINNGYIVGAGGNGNGGAGGRALLVSFATTITNNGTIGGGGGAGGGQQAYSYSSGGYPPSSVYVAAQTGGGGAGSVAGSPGGSLTAGGGGGGGGGALGAAGGSATWGGGAAGIAVSGNSLITWSATGTRLGAVNA